MQPDLFAGPAQRDDSHRILARLANGGNVPSAPRRWDTAQRARMAAVIALLAAIAAAWAWLQDGLATRPAKASVAALPAAAVRTANRYPSEPQAAAIVNEPARPAPALAPPPAVARSSAEAVPRFEPRAAPLRAPRPATPSHAKRSEPETQGDEDVTLLTAMLKHANGQKPAPTPPANE